MMDEVDEFAGKTENKMKRPGEATSPTSPKRKWSLALQLMKQEGEGDFPLQGAAGSKETGTTDIHDIHDKKPENDETSSVLQLKNMAGDISPPKKLESLSDDLTCLRKDEMIHSPGSVAVIEGTSKSNPSVDDTKVTKMPTLESRLQRGPQKVNDHIKCQLRKEIRKFGRKYERIFILLEDVQGPPEVKKEFIEFTIKEATRFKRCHLIKHLEKLQEEIASD